MGRAGDDHEHGGGPGRVPPFSRIERLLGRVALGVALVAAFELVLYLTAVTLFTHVDTPACAGADTFCSPDGRPGITGGAAVVVAGNLLAVVAVLVLLVLARRRSSPARP